MLVERAMTTDEMAIATCSEHPELHRTRLACTWTHKSLAPMLCSAAACFTWIPISFRPNAARARRWRCARTHAGPHPCLTCPLPHRYPLVVQRCGSSACSYLWPALESRGGCDARC